MKLSLSSFLIATSTMASFVHGQAECGSIYDPEVKNFYKAFPNTYYNTFPNVQDRRYYAEVCGIRGQLGGTESLYSDENIFGISLYEQCRAVDDVGENGWDACENKGFNRADCAKVGCCFFNFLYAQCFSVVGSGVCPGGGIDQVFVEFKNVPCTCPMLPIEYQCNPSSSPSSPPSSSDDAGAMTDPHFKTWSGIWYDFMGACDLHLLQAPQLDLTIDIRTKIRYEYSFIESVAVKLGEDILEVGSYGVYFLNGVEGARLPMMMAEQHPVSYNKLNKKRSEFVIGLDRGEKIVVSTMKDMVSVKIENAHTGRFSDSVGMMGEFGTGFLFARDSKTVVEDPIDLAGEWQVRDNESVLFQAVEGPQYPHKCDMPAPVSETTRRLGETIAREAAETACARHTEKAAFEACVHDVMATGDLELADAGAF